MILKPRVISSSHEIIVKDTLLGCNNTTFKSDNGSLMMTFIIRRQGMMSNVIRC